MKKAIPNITDKLTKDDKFHINTNKKNSLINFLGVFPEMITKAVTSTNIQEGFLTTGIVDAMFHCYVDFNQMLAICRRNQSELKNHLCIKSFPALFKIFVEKGHIGNDIFECLGFKQDCNIKCDIVRRTATVSQEYIQRAKCLTH